MRKINEWLVEKYITWMLARYVYQEDEREKVRFVLKSLLAEIEKLLLLYWLFGYLGKGKEFLISILVLLGIRRYIGGFHAKTILGCIIVSFLYISLGIWISERIQITEEYVEMVYLLCASIIYLWAPLKSVNRPVYTVEQKLRMQVKALLYLIIVRAGGRLFKMEILILSILMLQLVEVIMKKCLIELEGGVLLRKKGRKGSIRY